MPSYRTLLTTVLSLFFLLSCEREERFESTYLTLSTNTISVSAAGAVRNVLLSSNGDWTLLTPLPSWLEMTSNGTAPDFLLVFTVAENSGVRSRSAFITLGDGNMEETLTVTQAANPRLSVLSEREQHLPSGESSFIVSLETNCIYSVDSSEDWLKLKGTESGNHSGAVRKYYRQESLEFSVAENTVSRSRSATLVFFNESRTLSDTVWVFQEGAASSWYADSDWECIQRASCSPAPSLCIMGDGFIREDLEKDGTYRSVMLQAAEYFFNVEPYSSYRSCFNVYIIYAESAERGVGDKVRHKVVNNRFGSKYGKDTEIDCNADLCLQYAAYADGGNLTGPLTALVVLNDSKYAGTTYMYMNGNSVALCPMTVGTAPNDFEGAVHHECGGHGFGFLADEYVYYDKRMPDSEISELRTWQGYGYQTNLDLSGNVRTCFWSDFVGREGYEGVGLFEGGGLYRYGVWRSESNSCMNNNVAYFNVQSRQAIVRRIMSMCGREFSLDEFIAADTGSPMATRASMMFSYSSCPLGRPKLISYTYQQ